MGKICFFFGAGAECGTDSFGLPSGPAYTVATMRQKNEKLYSALRIFYKDRLSSDYVREYRNAFLFEKGSHTFNEIIFRAAKNYINYYTNCGKTIADYSDYSDIIEFVKETTKGGKTDEKLTKDQRQKFYSLADNAYELLIKEWKPSVGAPENSPRKAGEEILKFENFVEFYGAVEKDFSAIIDPQKIGTTQFWRVINYYWSAFFSILKPASKQFSWSTEKYYASYVLENLSTVIYDLWNEYNYNLYDSKSGNYYKNVQDSFSDYKVLTTNYTPFVDHYFKENAIYLGGRLSEFEYPTQLCVKDIKDVSVGDKDFLFPFIMTQAPIKPLVVSNQVREYSKMIKALNLDKQNSGDLSTSGGTILVIIGYSIGDADNHINSILREFACNPQNRILYCKLKRDKEANEKSVQEDIYKRLRLGNEDTELKNIDVLLHKGNAKELMQRIQNYIAGEAPTPV